MTKSTYIQVMSKGGKKGKGKTRKSGSRVEIRGTNLRLKIVDNLIVI